MKQGTFVLGLAALMATSQAVAKDKPLPLEPVDKPDWAKAREQGESQLKKDLFDPGSAQITYTSGFQWGYTKPIIGGKAWGWVACGTYNAKNRMGGYVGAKQFTVIIAPGGGTSIFEDIDFGTCGKGAAAPLQPELKDQAVLAQQDAGRIGVAGELEKLADLKAKGVITQAEFDAQKTKLLAR